MTTLLRTPGPTREREGPCLETLTPEVVASLTPTTPALVCDTSVMEARYWQMRHLLPEMEVFYAVKCNPSAGVLDTLSRVGAGFEIASRTELDLVEAAGGSAAGVLYSNPVKPPEHIAATHARGVRRFALDGEGEVRKLAAHAPGSQVYVRLRVDDHHSLFPLSGKFGTSVDEACRLLVLARDLGLEPHGATFHVGSQCTDALAWPRAIARCGVLLRMLHRHGISLEMLDIGGGFPAQYCEPVPSFETIALGVRQALDRLPHRPPRLVAEPGRFLVAESSVMVATVIGVERREDGSWCYLDVGGYNGLMETVQTGGRWRFPLRTTADGSGPSEDFTVTGPSCDSSDTMFYGVQLPASLTVGDQVLIGSTGAYTISYGSNFNGFAPPATVFVDGAPAEPAW